MFDVGSGMRLVVRSLGSVSFPVVVTSRSELLWPSLVLDVCRADDVTDCTTNAASDSEGSNDDSWVEGCCPAVAGVHATISVDEDRCADVSRGRGCVLPERADGVKTIGCC